METNGPAAYLEVALPIIGERALHARLVDWETIAEQAREQARNASDTAGTYPAIRSALRALGDGHSFLMTSSAVERWYGDVPEPSMAPRLEINGRIACVSIGAFVSGNSDVCARYAVQLQREIASVLREVMGWIVDLRANTGGNMWPMLCGLGPILGDGEHGAFFMADASRLSWGYRSGRGYVGDVNVLAIDPVHRLTPRKPIAVLIGPETRSSGEAIAVAFRGLPDTRFFGAPSAGLSTCNEDIALSDGARLFLTTGVYVDRAGRQYPSGVSPDVYCGEDETMAIAQAWIASMSSSHAIGF